VRNINTYLMDETHVQSHSQISQRRPLQNLSSHVLTVFVHVLGSPPFTGCAVAAEASAHYFGYLEPYADYADTPKKLSPNY